MSLLRNSQDRFCIFDPVSLKKTSFKVEGSSRCVTVDYARAQTNTFLSGDFDGIVRLWDIRQPRRPASVSEAGRDVLHKGATFSTAAISPDARFVCAGSCAISINKKKRKRTKKSLPSKRRRGVNDVDNPNADGDDDSSNDDDTSPAYILCWDTRQFGRPLYILDDIHSDHVNHVTFDPSSNSHRLLSCADDGLLCVADFDAANDDRLIEVFNAEGQINYCGFLNRLLPSESPSGVFAFDNMRSHFSAWPLTPADAPEGFETPPAWRRLTAPKMAKVLLTATSLPGQVVGSQPAVCLVSTRPMKEDIRLSIATPQGSQLLAKHRLFKRTPEPVECDPFYAEFLSVPEATKSTFDLLVVGRHSVNRMEASLSK
ncbi:unnamed protein product [Mesocestoides corti]|uniref:WD repeat-containing protein 89 n=1 Tax=Mesocestoides corti TaxID=53468 RepID=A0A0R3UEY0_MESCO|nr:unnamed protein product [Mesocestoides corti]